MGKFWGKLGGFYHPPSIPFPHKSSAGLEKRQPYAKLEGGTVPASKRNVNCRGVLQNVSRTLCGGWSIFMNRKNYSPSALNAPGASNRQISMVHTFGRSIRSLRAYEFEYESYTHGILSRLTDRTPLRNSFPLIILLR
jgi:hypothetical protein